jgi:hypothetical protein
MRWDADSLYQLLPAIHRVRDAERGEPLKALVAVLAEQARAVEENLDQLYDDQFIETCAEWVAPYIGDLVGYRALHSEVPGVSSPRAEVANTIAYRRRKGTASMLEQLARDVTGWSAHAVEFFQLLTATQWLNHIRKEHFGMPDLRRWETSEYIATPFDRIPRTVDVRRIEPGRGEYNIPNIGLFLWRLGAYSLTRSPAVRFANDPTRYLFSPLGADAPIFNDPVTEAMITQLARQNNVPMPIGRRAMHEQLAQFYGPGNSVLLELADLDGAGQLDPSKQPVAVPAAQVQVCNLNDLTDATGNVITDGNGDAVWAHGPASKISIDPSLGRIAFPGDPRKIVLGTFHYGFSADMGGGEYEREDTLDLELQPVVQVRMPSAIQAGLDTLNGTGVVEVRDSGRYAETLTITAARNSRIEVRSANEARPTIVLADEMQISGVGADVTLNGLLIIGGPLRVLGKLRTLRLRHCTIVPASVRDNAGDVQPNVIVGTASTTLIIEDSIVGGVRVANEAQAVIKNSIVDATDETAMAYAGTRKANDWGGKLSIENSSVIGKVRARRLGLASNTIFLAARALSDPEDVPPVNVERRQEGCARFSYLPPGSQTPRRHNCQPATDDPTEATRVRPQFTSLRIGDPGYGQLARRCAKEILTGADDEAEMGAFHNLYAPQREANLRLRLDEYLRFGLEAGISYAS